jgi:nucleotide-binding universal stress UspA family protein
VNAWLVLPAIVLLAAALIVVPGTVATFVHWRRPFRVRCPRAAREGQIRVGPLGAAVAAVLGREAPTVARCSLWREVPECHEECVGAGSVMPRPVPVGTPPPHADGPRKILVPLDGRPGSEAVIDTVGFLARTAGATVRLLRVARRVEPVVSDDGRVIAFADQEAGRVEREARAYLDGLAARLPGVAVECAVRFGDPVAEIVEDAESAGAEVIAMASRRRAGAARQVRRSVARRLGRRTRIPLVLVPYGPRPVAPDRARENGR